MIETKKQSFEQARDSESDFKSGFCSFIGRPNSGKSTLINAILGKKIAITSHTAQTTRHRLRAVLTRPAFQLILTDTPGLHKPHDVLGEELNTAALKSLEDIDVVVMLIDASKPLGKGDKWVAQHVHQAKAKKILVLSKCDLVSSEELTKQISAAQNLLLWDKITCLSAKTGEGLDFFISELASLLPNGPHWFPEDMDSDQPIEVIVSEFIREKILRNFRDEIPHAIGVVTDEMEYDTKKNLYRINANIFVERESQKGMIIGKAGSSIKSIGTHARSDLEQLLGQRVYLELKVKVKKNWRRDLSQIRRFGYGEGAY